MTWGVCETPRILTVCFWIVYLSCFSQNKILAWHIKCDLTISRRQQQKYVSILDAAHLWQMSAVYVSQNWRKIVKVQTMLQAEINHREVRSFFFQQCNTAARHVSVCWVRGMSLSGIWYCCYYHIFIAVVTALCLHVEKGKTVKTTTTTTTTTTTRVQVSSWKVFRDIKEISSRIV